MRSSSVLISALRSSSALLGGTGPDGRTRSVGSPASTGRSSSAGGTPPTSAVVSPRGSPPRLNWSWKVGRRRSVSTSATRCPDSATARARPAATVDLPSPGTALVTSTTRTSPPTVRKSSPLRRIRNGSSAAARSRWLAGLRVCSGTVLSARRP